MSSKPSHPPKRPFQIPLLITKTSLRRRASLHRPTRPHRQARRREAPRKARGNIVIIHAPSPTTHIACPSTAKITRLVPHKRRLALDEARRGPTFLAVLETEDGVRRAGLVGGGEGGDTDVGGHVEGGEELDHWFSSGRGGFGVAAQGVEAVDWGAGGGGSSVGGCGGAGGSGEG